VLILTRRTGESVHIGNDIVVVILGTKGNQVRIGIDADPSIPVHRKEIFDRIKEEEAAAAALAVAAAQ